MKPKELETLKIFSRRLRELLANRLTYPKVIIGMAQQRFLTDQEVIKIYECLEDCLQTVEVETAALLWDLRNQ